MDATELHGSTSHGGLTLKPSSAEEKRFSLFMPLSLLEQAADTGFATHENTRGETIYAFRAENLSRYIDALIAEGSREKTRPSEPSLKKQPTPSHATDCDEAVVEANAREGTRNDLHPTPGRNMVRARQILSDSK
jgi:hypothetical protein